MFAVCVASLTVVPQTLRPLSTGRSPALSTAAARARHQTQQPSFVPLATRYRNKHEPVGSPRKHAVGNTRAQMELMQGYVHRTGMHNQDSVPSKGQAPEPNLKPLIEPPAAAYQTVPTAREAAPAPRVIGAVLGGLRQNQKSRWASQVAKAADEVAVEATKQTAVAAAPDIAAAPQSNCVAPQSAQPYSQLRRLWLRKRICWAYTYQQGWEDGQWLSDCGGRTIAAIATAATRATTATAATAVAACRLLLGALLGTLAMATALVTKVSSARPLHSTCAPPSARPLHSSFASVRLCTPPLHASAQKLLRTPSVHAPLSAPPSSTRLAPALQAANFARLAGGRRGSAAPLADGAIPEEYPALYAFFPERGMVKLTEQERRAAPTH